MDMSSVTIDTLGLPKEIQESGIYDSVKNKLYKMDRKTQNLEMQRIGAAPEYVLPLESERANKAYNITTGSNVSKLLIINKEKIPGRLTLILVKEKLGF